MSEFNKPTNPPAFPHVADILQFDGNSTTVKTLTQNGMTLRDYMAAKALQGGIDVLHTSRFATKDELAVWCYEWADAMLKAREQ